MHREAGLGKVNEKVVKTEKTVDDGLILITGNRAAKDFLFHTVFFFFLLSNVAMLPAF